MFKKYIYKVGVNLELVGSMALLFKTFVGLYCFTSMLLRWD